MNNIVVNHASAALIVAAVMWRGSRSRFFRVRIISRRLRRWPITAARCVATGLRRGWAGVRVIFVGIFPILRAYCVDPFRVGASVGGRDADWYWAVDLA